MLKNKFVIITALVGIILMVLTLAFNINPVEASVVPVFLTGNKIGRLVMIFLFVTCMPAWIAGLLLACVIPFLNPDNNPGWLITCFLICIIQAIIYAGLGKLISLVVARLKHRSPPKG